MREEDKQNALDMIAIRIATAEHHNLNATAKSWRDLYYTVASRPAAEIVSVQSFEPELQPYVQHLEVLPCTGS